MQIQINTAGLTGRQVLDELMFAQAAIAGMLAAYKGEEVTMQQVTVKINAGADAASVVSVVSVVSTAVRAAMPPPPVTTLAPEDDPEAGAAILTQDEVRELENLPPADNVTTHTFPAEDIAKVFSVPAAEVGDAMAADEVRTAQSLPPARDAAGLPWDGRIHASSKGLIADGTWRQKRNVDQTLLATVTAELKAAAGVPPAPPVAAMPPPPPGAAPAAATASPFATLLIEVGKAKVAGRVTDAEVNDAIAKVTGGAILTLAGLASRGDLAGEVRAALGDKL